MSEKFRRAGAAARTCHFCAAPFMPLTAKQYTCGAASCVQRRRQQTAARWYAVNRDAHVRRVVARRRGCTHA